MVRRSKRSGTGSVRGQSRPYAASSPSRWRSRRASHADLRGGRVDVGRKRARPCAGQPRVGDRRYVRVVRVDEVRQRVDANPDAQRAALLDRAPHPLVAQGNALGSSRSGPTSRTARGDRASSGPRASCGRAVRRRLTRRRRRSGTPALVAPLLAHTPSIIRWGAPQRPRWRQSARGPVPPGLRTARPSSRRPSRPASEGPACRGTGRSARDLPRSRPVERERLSKLPKGAALARVPRDGSLPSSFSRAPPRVLRLSTWRPSANAPSRTTPTISPTVSPTVVG